MDTHEFFETFFADKAPQTDILVWTLPDKATRTFRTAREASTHALAVRHAKKNVYFGVGTRGTPPTEGKRGTAKSVAELFGLWVDIDIAGPGHKKGNLPPTLDDALSILAELPHDPSIVVHSGGGLQAYWLFDSHVPPSPQILSLVYGWQERVKEVAHTLGAWDVDSVHDAARVMRVPGTFNCKMEPPVEARVLSSDGVRYAPEDFLPWSKTPPDPATDLHTSTITFDPAGAVPPFDKWETLKQLDPKIKATWERKRKDLRDQSASGHDMSLSLFAVNAGWTDQEVVNLLLANHRQHGEAPKNERYYTLTVAKARDTCQKDESQQAIDEYLLSQPEDAPIEGDDAETMRNHVSHLLGVRVLHLYKYLSDPPTYRLEFEGGSIFLGESKNLLSQQVIRCAVADASGKVIRAFPDAQWRGLCEMMLKLREDIPVGDEATDAGSIVTWLHEYLDDRPPNDPTPEALRMRQSMHKGGHVYVFLRHFAQWLHAKYAEKISAKMLGGLMRHSGATLETVYIPLETGGNTTTTGWKLPEQFDRHLP